MPYHRCAVCGTTSYSAAAYTSVSVCPTCPAELGEGTEVYLVPGAKRDVSRSLLARPEAAAEARRTLSTLALPEVTREDLALIVTELVTNSVLHAGLSTDDHVDVNLTNGRGTINLAVHDSGHGFTSPPSDAGDPQAPGGRGLLIVAALSDSWGIECDRAGCTVWCQVLVEEHDTAGAERGVANGYGHAPPIELVAAGSQAAAR